MEKVPDAPAVLPFEPVVITSSRRLPETRIVHSCLSRPQKSLWKMLLSNQEQNGQLPVTLHAKLQELRWKEHATIVPKKDLELRKVIYTTHSRMSLCYIILVGPDITGQIASCFRSLLIGGVDPLCVAISHVLKESPE